MVSLFNELSQCEFQILAFPCNQFGGQEPGTDAEIARFAESQGVKFAMFAKVDVNGPETCAVWQYLKVQFPGDIKWNFDTHFLVARNGTVRLTRTCARTHRVCCHCLPARALTGHTALLSRSGGRHRAWCAG